MIKPETEIENQIAEWQARKLSLELLRRLPAKIGREGYEPGIPALFELAVSADEIVRYNAIMSLSFKFGWRGAKDLLCRILQQDPDEDCRDAAAGGLGYLFNGDRDCSLLRLLGAVCSIDDNEDVRRSAYAALLRVSGRSDEENVLLQTGPRPPVNTSMLQEILSECSARDPS